MTKQETILIMAKLSAFYGQGKSDVRMMADAWHEILGEYDFMTANNAVTQFAKHDVREYATFPAVGCIVEAIEKEQGVKQKIFNFAFNGRLYEELPMRAKEIISKEQFEWFKGQHPEYLRLNKDAILAKIDGIYREAQLENNDKRDTAEHEQIQRQNELLGIPE